MRHYKVLRHAIKRLLNATLALAMLITMIQPVQAMMITSVEPIGHSFEKGTLAEVASREELQGAVAFCVGESLALASGKISQIDEDDRMVVAWVDPSNDRAYAPLRYIADALQVIISWDGSTQKITMLNSDKKIELQVGQKEITIDGKVLAIDAAPLLQGSRVYLPLRVIANALDLGVHYHEGIVVLQDEAKLQVLQAEYSSTLQLLSLKLKPLGNIGSYENFLLLMEESFGRNIFTDMNYDFALLDDGFVLNSATKFDTSLGLEMRESAEMSVTTGAQPMAPSSLASSNDEVDFSSTNTQVEGVDEADIVKTDGQYIYIVKNQMLLIISALPADQMKIFSSIKIDENIRLEELFLEQDRVVLLAQKNYQSANMTVAYIYDIKDKANPVLQRTIEVEGHYLTARRIGSCYYLISNKNLYWHSIASTSSDPRPIYMDSIANDGEMIAIPYSEIKCFPDFQEANFLMVTGFDAASNQPADIHSYLGAGETIYVADDALFVAMSQYQYRRIYDYDETRNGKATSNHWQTMTRVFSFALNEGKIQFKAKGDVPGQLLNQFSMDQYQNHLRLATNMSPTYYSAQSEMVNQISVLDDNLSLVGSIGDIAPGERIYSVRFMGERAFMVTFKTVDPLFVIDLKDPTQPKILGELKIPGYSDYLHPIGQDYLLGFGKDAISFPIKDSRGIIYSESSYYLGFKLSLFDVRDLANPKELAMVIIGDRGTESGILHNHKALLYNANTGFLAFPISEYRVLNGPLIDERYDYPNYGSLVFDGLVIFDIDPEAGEMAIQEKGRITQQTSDIDLLNELYLNYQLSITRGLYIGDVIYTLSQGRLQANSMSDYHTISYVTLP